MPCYDPRDSEMEKEELEDGREAARILCALLKQNVGKGDLVDIRRAWIWFAKHRKIDHSRIYGATPENIQERAGCLYDIQTANHLLQVTPPDAKAALYIVKLTD